MLLSPLSSGSIADVLRWASVRAVNDDALESESASDVESNGISLASSSTNELNCIRVDRRVTGNIYDLFCFLTKKSYIFIHSLVSL